MSDGEPASAGDVLEHEPAPARPASPARRRRFGRRTALLLVLVLLAAAGGYAGFVHWWPVAAPWLEATGLTVAPPPADGAAAPATSESPPDPAAAVAARLDALGRRSAEWQAALDAVTAQAQAMAADTAAQRERLAGLEAQIGELAERVEAIAAAPPSHEPVLPGEVQALATRVTGLEARIGDLASRLDSMEAMLADRPAPVPESAAAVPAGPVVADLARDLASLAGRLAELEDRPVAAPDDLAALGEAAAARAARLDDLDRRFAELEAALPAAAERDGRAVGLVLAVARLSAAARRSEPFRTEWETVRLLAEGIADTAAALESLAATASVGAPSRTRLHLRFPAVVEAVLKARHDAGATGMVGRAVAAIASLVTVRRIEPGGDGGAATADLLLLEAERLLAEGELAGAVAALDRLDGPAAAAASGWLAAARARLAVERATEMLEATVLALLQPGG